MDPAPNRTGMCGQGGTGTVPVFTDRSLVEVGARLYPRGIATTTPQHFTVASGQACANPGQEFSAHRAKRDARIRTAPSPDPSGLSWWTLRRLHAPVPRVHLFVSLAGPTPSDGAGTSRLHKGPLATLPGTSRVRLPPASPPCCDRTAVQVSHLHSIDQRLTAHTHIVHRADHRPERARPWPGRGRSRGSWARSWNPAAGPRSSAVLPADSVARCWSPPDVAATSESTSAARWGAPW